MHFERHFSPSKCIKLYISHKKVSPVNLGQGWVTLNTGIFYFGLIYIMHLTSSDHKMNSREKSIKKGYT